MFVIKPEQLNRNPEDISLMSYNILLPNSHLGWWVYKYYHPDTPNELTSWPYRQKLLSQQLNIGADLLTLQECNSETVATDLEFLWSRYEFVCHRKARIAMVTCWNKERFTLLSEYHLNRCLVTVLEELKGVQIAVVNCHLSAGRQPKERFQQIVKAIDQVRKLKSRFDLKLIILSGDFNSTAEGTAVQRFLEDGVVEPRFRERGYPDVEITSKIKEHSLGQFEECYRHLCDTTTMLVRNSSASMVHSRTRKPREQFIEALKQLFAKYTNGSTMMSKAQMEQWICDINQGLRGSEYRSAVERMEGGFLTENHFVQLYLQEVQSGKHWAVHNDLLRKGIELPTPRPFCIQFALDQVWIRSINYECSGVVQPIGQEERAKLESGDFAPNSWHPSDHFPLLIRLSPKLW